MNSLESGEADVAYMAGYIGDRHVISDNTCFCKLRLKICKDPDPESFPFFMPTLAYLEAMPKAIISSA